jgi:hypothetical protein
MFHRTCLRFNHSYMSDMQSHPLVEPSGPAVVVSPKKRHSVQKGSIKGMTPDSEVWNLNDDDIIGIVFCCSVAIMF